MNSDLVMINKLKYIKKKNFNKIIKLKDIIHIIKFLFLIIIIIFFFFFIDYSFGISLNIQLDYELAKRGIDVYMYDHTIKSLSYNNPKYHCSKIGICGRNNKAQNLKTLED